MMELSPASPSSRPGYGFVYVVQSGDEYRFKIGYSVNLLRRMKALQTGSPVQLHLIGFYMTDDPWQHEAWWHQQLGLNRKHGEWFDLPLEALQRLACNFLVFGRDPESLESNLMDGPGPYFVSIGPGSQLEVTLEDRDSQEPNLVWVKAVHQDMHLKCQDGEVADDARGSVLRPINWGLSIDPDRRAAYDLHAQCNRAMRLK